MADEEYRVVTRMEDITEADDRSLAGAKREFRNELSVIIPENPFPEIEVDAYPPLKFVWLIPKKLAAMAYPRNKENLKFLINQGITHLVTLTAGKKPPVDDIDRLRWTEIPIEEFGVPSVDDVKKFIELCKRADKNGEKNRNPIITPVMDRHDPVHNTQSWTPLFMDIQPWTSLHDDYKTRKIRPFVSYFDILLNLVMGVHCRQGRSRSPVMLACYLMHFHRFLPDQAMNVVRMIRPGSLEWEEQEEAVGKYFMYLTEDNPLKFGVSGELMEEMIESAKEATKKALG